MFYDYSHKQHRLTLQARNDDDVCEDVSSFFQLLRKNKAGFELNKFYYN